MGFRNPAYLDLSLPKNMADYYGVDVPAAARVVRRIVAERGSGTWGPGTDHSWEVLTDAVVVTVRWPSSPA